MSIPMLEGKAAFALRGHNPDVLTCIANLSNDEVFTPPELANQMLDTVERAWAEANDGASIWADPTVTFLDPFTKSGVFLREIVSRLTVGLEERIPDLQDRVDHILTKQVYGVGITQLTALLARRSVYCSKDATGEHSIAKTFDRDWGNIWFERTEHTWAGDRCAYCPASRSAYDRGVSSETHAYAFIHSLDVKARVQRMFGADVQFDVVVGNPPYQLGESGGESVGGFAMPIYQKFVQSAKALEPRFVALVTPSRWFAGGRGLDEFRAEMLNDTRLRTLVDFPDSTEAFPGADVSGGVSYFLWDREYDGQCRVSTIVGGERIDQPVDRMLNEFDVFVRFNTGVRILQKVRAVIGSGPALSTRVSPIQPFSLRTSFRGEATAQGLSDPIAVRGKDGITYIERADIPRNQTWADEWKLALGRAYGERGGYPYKVFSAPFILPPGAICTETYLVIDRFDSEVEAENLRGYLATRLVRFLVSLRKNTQDIYNERFAFVPLLDMTRSWSDEDLSTMFGLDEDEITFVERMVRPLELDDA
jgi:site-specific DNA-methyltransferase (adenine-specific)